MSVMDGLVQGLGCIWCLYLCTSFSEHRKIDVPELFYFCIGYFHVSTSLLRGKQNRGKLGKFYFNSTDALIVEIVPYFYNCSGYISMDFLIAKGSLTGLSSVWPLPKL